MATSTWVQGKLECEPNQWKWLQLNWLKSTPWLGQGPVSLSSRPIALPNFSALVLPPSMAAPIDLDPESQHRQNWLCLVALLPNELVMQLRKCRNGPLDPTDDQLFPWGSLGPHRKLLDSQATHASRLTTLETVTSRGTPSKRWKESLPTQRLCKTATGRFHFCPGLPWYFPVFVLRHQWTSLHHLISWLVDVRAFSWDHPLAHQPSTQWSTGHGRHLGIQVVRQTPHHWQAGPPFSFEPDLPGTEGKTSVTFRMTIEPYRDASEDNKCFSSPSFPRLLGWWLNWIVSRAGAGTDFLRPLAFVVWNLPRPSVWNSGVTLEHFIFAVSYTPCTMLMSACFCTGWQRFRLHYFLTKLCVCVKFIASSRVASPSEVWAPLYVELLLSGGDRLFISRPLNLRVLDWWRWRDRERERDKKKQCQNQTIKKNWAEFYLSF